MHAGSKINASTFRLTGDRFLRHCDTGFSMTRLFHRAHVPKVVGGGCLSDAGLFQERIMSGDLGGEECGTSVFLVFLHRVVAVTSFQLYKTGLLTTTCKTYLDHGGNLRHSTSPINQDSPYREGPKPSAA